MVVSCGESPHFAAMDPHFHHIRASNLNQLESSTCCFIFSWTNLGSVLIASPKQIPEFYCFNIFHLEILASLSMNHGLFTIPLRWDTISNCSDRPVDPIGCPQVYAPKLLQANPLNFFLST